MSKIYFELASILKNQSSTSLSSLTGLNLKLVISLANSRDPDQTVPSGSALFVWVILSCDYSLKVKNIYLYII